MPDQQCTATRHGSEYAYTRHGCRCPDVVDQMRAYWRGRPSRPYKPTGTKGSRDHRPDVDTLAVALVADDGHQLNLTAGERRAVVAALTDRGWPPRRIADRLGVSRRTVHRHKAA
jgi:DNA-binding NarL/FixJ family response regulator